MLDNLLQMVVVTLTVAIPLVFVVVAVWWGVLRLLDIVGGVRFTDNWEIMRRDPAALGGYCGRRSIAVAIIVAGICVLLAALLRL